MENIQKIDEWSIFPKKKKGQIFHVEPREKTPEELLVDKYNEILKPYEVEIGFYQKREDDEIEYHLNLIKNPLNRHTYPYGVISVFTDVDYVIYRYTDETEKRKKLNNLDDAINFVIQRKKDEKEMYRKSRREYTQESVIPFSMFEEQGSGDLPACSCPKKKRKEKKQKKMKWSSDMMSEKCGVCGGIKKKKKKGGKFLIKDFGGISHIN